MSRSECNPFWTGRGGYSLAFLLALCLFGVGVKPALAVPAFGIQTGKHCQACHVGGFGPQLTPYGREFKLTGYTDRTNPFNAPFSAMAVMSYVQTQKAQVDPPAPGYRTNDNLALDQVSLFFAGGFGQHLGAFVQTTYSGTAKAWTWDNLDIRATTKTTIARQPTVLGLSLNNSPSVQDAWNTLPAWGYRYTTSSLAPSPSASPPTPGSTHNITSRPAPTALPAPPPWFASAWTRPTPEASRAWPLTCDWPTSTPSRSGCLNSAHSAWTPPSTPAWTEARD